MNKAMDEQDLLDEQGTQQAEPQPPELQMPEVSPPSLDFPGLRESAEAMARQSETSIAGFPWIETHQKITFYWATISSVLIFLLVLGITIFGLKLSQEHFRASTKSKGDGSADSTFKVSKEGVEASSSVIGLSILTFSLVFFYLYLVHVHPVEIIDLTSPTGNSRDNAVPTRVDALEAEVKRLEQKIEDLQDN